MISEEAALGWTFRRIEAETGVRRETVSRYACEAWAKPAKTLPGSATSPRRIPSRPGSRHVPPAVRREVWRRDGGQCAFVGTKGRCEERGFLEFHHVVPFAAGGETAVGNLQLRCRPHNAYEAELYSGPSVVREVAARTARELSPDRVVWGVIWCSQVPEVGVEPAW